MTKPVSETFCSFSTRSIRARCSENWLVRQGQRFGMVTVKEAKLNELLSVPRDAFDLLLQPNLLQTKL